MTIFKSELEEVAWDPNLRGVVYGLYCTCEGCPTQEVRYVGQTLRTALERLRGHRVLARRVASGRGTSLKRATPVSRWMAKHGADNIQMAILEVVDSDPPRLNDAEERWIAHAGTVGTKRGLNIRIGGKNSPHGPMSEEQKRKIGLANKGFVPSPEHVARVRALLTSKRGEENYTHVLTDAKVVEIKSRLFRGEHHVDIAKDFQVSGSTISHIFYGKTWWHVEGPIGPYPKNPTRVLLGDKSANHKLSESQVRTIKGRLWDGEFPTDIAPEYGVSIGTIINIETGKSWAHVPNPTDRSRVVKDRSSRMSEKLTGKKRRKDWFEEHARTYREACLAKADFTIRDIRRVRSLRYEHGYRYDQISEELGGRLSKGAVGKICRGERWEWVE